MPAFTGDGAGIALTKRTIDAGIRAAKAEGKARKLADGRGLLLFVSAAGNTLWRYRYRLDGRESQITLGSYPEHDLDEARRRHVEARRLVLDGTDPAEERRAEKAAERAAAETSVRTRLTVRELVDLWLASPEAAGWAPTHERAVRNRVKVHVLGDPLADAAVIDVRPLAHSSGVACVDRRCLRTAWVQQRYRHGPRLAARGVHPAERGD